MVLDSEASILRRHTDKESAWDSVIGDGKLGDVLADEFSEFGR
jgi:hypothetical protein